MEQYDGVDTKQLDHPSNNNKVYVASFNEILIVNDIMGVLNGLRMFFKHILNTRQIIISPNEKITTLWVVKLLSIDTIILLCTD